jgi:hypothetical protein
MVAQKRVAIYQLIKRFEDRLHQLNIGLAVWCPEPLISVLADVAMGVDQYEEGSIDTQIVWAKGWKE